MPNRLLAGFAVIPMLALLAACGSGEDEDGRSASGEVLEGSISDAMLPLDSVQSQAPRAEPEVAPGEPGEVSEEESEDAAGPEQEPSAESEEAPDEAP